MSRLEKIHRLKFTASEDQRLREVVHAVGTSDWKLVSLHMSGRTARQCRDRWNNYLCPDIRRSQWTEDEEELLIRKMREIGGRWSILAHLFPGRSGIAIRNHCCKLARRKDADPILDEILFEESRKRIKIDVDDVRDLLGHINEQPEKLPSCVSMMLSADSTKIFPIFKRDTQAWPAFFGEFRPTQPPLKILPPDILTH